MPGGRSVHIVESAIKKNKEKINGREEGRHLIGKN